jgi:nitronate monooxygenase
VRPTAFTQRFKLDHPIIQAPMAGGGDTPELVAAIGNAGGFGVIGAAYLSAAQIAAATKRVAELSDRPFGINLFAAVPFESVDPRAAKRRVARFYEEIGVAIPGELEPPARMLELQVEAALESNASALTFTFGILPRHAIDAAKARGMAVMGTATTVGEARLLEAGGADFVVAQGAEAGGHRGSFAVPFDQGLIGTIALVPQIADAVSIPVIASGGIMDGRGIAAALMLGACAAQLGTAFLTTQEAGVAAAYKDAIIAAAEDETRITRAFSGRPARGIVNRFMREVEDGAAPGDILPFPLQNALTRPLRAQAAKDNRSEFLSLWAGQGTRMARSTKASLLMAALVAETEAALSGASFSLRED